MILLFAPTFTLIASASSILLLFSITVMVGLLNLASWFDSLAETLVATDNGCKLVHSLMVKAISNEQPRIGSCAGSQNLMDVEFPAGN